MLASTFPWFVRIGVVEPREVNGQRWLAARLELLEAEKALTRRSDALAGDLQVRIHAGPAGDPDMLAGQVRQAAAPGQRYHRDHAGP